MSKEPIRLIIIEDEQLLAQVLAAWIKHQPELEMAGCARDGEEGWALFLKTRPSLVLTDIYMPKLDGLELGRRLLRQKPPVRVVVMSGMTDPYTIWRVRQSGVHGFVDKSQGAEALMEGIRTVAAGGTYFSEVFERVKQEWLAQADAFYKILSEREQEVLRLVVSGWDDDCIATRLSISAATVAVHRKHVRQKLELHNDRDLVAYAHKWGLDRVTELPETVPQPPGDPVQCDSRFGSQP